MSRLKERYDKEIIKLKEKYKRNIFSLPKLKKIVISMGLAKVIKEKDVLSQHIKELSMLSGQKPIICKAKKSIANFKLRKGMAVGLKVTLRKKRMYDFLDRFINIVSPRIKDFRGFKIKTEGRGNFTIGIEDQQVFPEINLDEVKRVQGMNISFITSSKNNEECIELMKIFGFPIKEVI
ncbi:MAG: 50S ribosomal protein L5 [Chlamydiae bacterium SM23_39]|nr:MAG: 50S ribosomal protein L5 [Chlamydiae bacterium SM23_39]